MSPGRKSVCALVSVLLELVVTGCEHAAQRVLADHGSIPVPGDHRHRRALRL
jgi:hypothetical protein